MNRENDTMRVNDEGSNYQVSGLDSNTTLIVRLNSDNLFEGSRDKINVLGYVDGLEFDDPNNRLIYLAKHLTRDGFNVALSTSYRSRLAGDADVVLNGHRDKDFLERLSRNAEGKRIIGEQEILGIQDNDSYQSFISELRDYHHNQVNQRHTA